uniref:Uncharacterized protein n=1 Tax=Cacopsylla melanoneura TaxID=428564 RepID=A0A8D9BDJ1_9HEMI
MSVYLSPKCTYHLSYLQLHISNLSLYYVYLCFSAPSYDLLPSHSHPPSSILSLCPATYKKKKILSSIEDYYIRIGTMLERILLITVITLAYLYCPNRTE